MIWIRKIYAIKSINQIKSDGIRLNQFAFACCDFLGCNNDWWHNLCVHDPLENRYVVLGVPNQTSSNKVKSTPRSAGGCLCRQFWPCTSLWRHHYGGHLRGTSTWPADSRLPMSALHKRLGVNARVDGGWRGDQDARQIQTTTTTTTTTAIKKGDLPAKIDHIVDHGCYTCQDLFRTIALGTAAVGVRIAPSPKPGDWNGIQNTLRF